MCEKFYSSFGNKYQKLCSWILNFVFICFKGIICITNKEYFITVNIIIFTLLNFVQFNFFQHSVKRKTNWLEKTLRKRLFSYNLYAYERHRQLHEFRTILLIYDSLNILKITIFLCHHFR